MNYTYKIVDDESNITIGWANEIFGLNGEERIEKNIWQIRIENFLLDKEYVEYERKTKNQVTNFNLKILNNNGKPIGSYYINLSEGIYFNKIKEKSFILNVHLNELISKESIIIWNKWREQIPSEKNEWAILDFVKKYWWLENLRHLEKINDKIEEKLDNKVIIDGRFISDYISFHCAFGEAMNNKSSYYGNTLNTIKDCFCGGFGAGIPSKIIWKDSKIAKENLTIESIKAFYDFRLEQYNKLNVVESDVIFEQELVKKSQNDSYFDRIIKFLNQNNIEVILE